MATTASGDGQHHLDGAFRRVTVVGLVALHGPAEAVGAGDEVVGAGHDRGLRRQVTSAARADGRGRRPGAPDLERALREHWTRLGEPVPVSVEDYARSLDFSDGGAELAGALYIRGARRL